MEVLDTCHNLIEVFDGIFFRLGIFIDQPIEVAIISKFHEQEDLVLHFEVIIESDDVGMLQFFMEPDFSLDEFELSQGVEYPLVFVQSLDVFVQVDLLEREPAFESLVEDQLY